MPSLTRLAEKAGIRLTSAVLRRLPARIAVAVKERLELTRKLDYPKAEILLGLESTAAFHRASACRKEPETVAWIEAFLEPGEVLYDVGANVGAYSLVAFAATDGDCTIYAFEPSFANFAALCTNVRLNRGSDQMIPLQIALSDTTGLLTLHYSNVAPGAALHQLGEADEKAFEPAFRQSVPSYRLDQLVEELGLRRPNHLKIDVDGPELEVLRGAGELLADPGLRSILIEVDTTRDSGEIATLLQDRGFREHARHQRGPTGRLFNVIYER